MKRLVAFFVFFICVSTVIAYDDIYPTEIWFKVSDGSSWTYQKSDGNVFSVRIKEGALNLDNNNDPLLFDSGYNFSLLDGGGDSFFNELCSKEGYGPFATFYTVVDIYGFSGQGNKLFMKGFMENWFNKKGGSMTTFLIMDTFTNEKVAYDSKRDDSNRNRNKWRLFDSYLIGLGDRWTCEGGMYEGQGTDGAGTSCVIEAHFFGRVAESREQIDGYSEKAYKIEFGANISKVRVNNDEETVFATFWLVPKIGPVKVQDNVRGIEVVLKNYSIAPYSWERPKSKGQSVNPGSGKTTTTWGAIK